MVPARELEKTMTYEEALTWGIEHGLTIRFWVEDGAHRVWVCKLLDADTEERLLVDETHPDVPTALAAVVRGVEMIAEQFLAHSLPAPAPTLRLVHSA
jgi:hypothetical protein